MRQVAPASGGLAGVPPAAKALHGIASSTV
jgi:hypothetical protein